MVEYEYETFGEEWKNLTISNNFIFSKVITDEEICKELLEILLEIKVSKIQYIEDEKTMKFKHISKGVRFDAYVEDGEKVYNIEMQTSDTRNLSKRSRYYQSIIDLNNLKKGKAYDELKNSYVIFICTFDPFGKNLSKYTFENICRENTDLYLKDGAYKVFLNSEAHETAKSENLKAFLNMFKVKKQIISLLIN